MIVLQYAAVVLVGYLLGSIPSGYIAGRVRGVDVREYGSGRTGGTNVLRTVGKKAFAFTVVCDMLKGAVAVLLARALLGTEAAAVLGGIAAVVGHNWSVFIGFRGGAGTGTSVGGYFFLNPVLAIVVGVFSALVGFRILRYASVTSILICLLMAPALLIGVLFFNQPVEHLVYALAVGGIVLLSHRPNIKRLLQGTERRMGQPARKMVEEKA